MTSSGIKRQLILTGTPGIGKTTIIKHICTNLNNSNIPFCGFYTEDVRKNGYRVGFDIVNVDGTRARLARVADERESIPVNCHKVGKYSVLVKEFEMIVIPIFEMIKKMQSGVVILDEIGKMEMFSNIFVSNIKQIFQQNNENIIIATIPVAKGKPITLVESIRNDKRNTIFTVNNTNRDDLPTILTQIITSTQ